MLYTNQQATLASALGEQFAIASWMNFVKRAVLNADLRLEYEVQTGRKLALALRPDAETAVAHFAQWVSEHHWGLENVPVAIRERLEGYVR